MQEFDLAPPAFRLILSAFRAFQHLYTVDDQLRCLACVRRHLAPGGLFAFDVFNPDLARLGRSDEDTEEARFILDGVEIVRHTGITRDRPTQLTHVVMRYQRQAGGELVDEGTAEFRMRWFFRYELEHLLARAGFAVVARGGELSGATRSSRRPARAACTPHRRPADTA